MTTTPRTKAAAVQIRKHLRRHPGALATKLDGIARRHKVPLDVVLRYMADHGQGTISRYDGTNHRRFLIQHDQDLLDRERQRVKRTYGELLRQCRAARGLLDRKPTNEKIREVSITLDRKAINLGAELGHSIEEVLELLQPDDAT